MKNLLSGFVLALMALCTATSPADIIFSSSDSDALAGNSVSVSPGQSGSIYVWVSTDVGQTMTGISFNVLGSDATVVGGTAHLVQNPGPRWSTVQAGGVNTSGNLLNNHRAFYLPGLSQGEGISTGGLDTFVLHSELQFDALQLGTTDLTLTPTTAGISFLGVGGNQWNNVTKGVGSISVVPEPSSLLALLAGGVGIVLVRRRR